MRPLESVLLATVGAFWLIWWLRPQGLSRWGVPIAGFALIVCLGHLGLEGARWQLVPTYFGAAAGWLLGQRARSRGRLRVAATDGAPDRSALRRIGAIATRAVVALIAVPAIALPILLPVFRLPEPSGVHAIGRTGFHLEERDRAEVLTPDRDDHRIIAVEAWYPAQPTEDSRPEPYWPLPGERSRILAGSWGLPSFLFSHLSLVRSHGHRDAPPARGDGPFPVLVFSHGLTEGYPEQNSALLEALASHGYVVFSIAHTWESLLVVLPDGTRAPLDKRVEAAFLDDLEQIKPLRDSLDGLGPEARPEVMAEIFRRSGAVQRSVDIWRQDTVLLLDALEELNSGARPSVLAGALDLDRIGVLGMSFGGATAGEVCLHDQRVVAGANLDGYHYGNALVTSSVLQPFMTMVGRQGVRHGNEEFVSRSRGGGLLVHIPSANHFDFSDFTLFGGLFRLLPLLGDIPPGEMLEITESFVLGFFDHHLRQRPIDPLLDRPPPGVEVRTFEPADRPE